MLILSDYHRTTDMAKVLLHEGDNTMWNRIKNWWQAEGDLVGLQGVSDRMLADMGLEREGLRDRVLGRVSEVADPQRSFVGSEVQVACRC
jgi:uncharacterized protein YjiS (DUF1127 family)